MKIFGKEIEGSEQYEWDKKRRGQVVIPEVVMDEFMEIANRHHTTISDVFRKILKFGLVSIKTRDSGEARLLHQTREGTQELKVFGDEPDLDWVA